MGLTPFLVAVSLFAGLAAAPDPPGPEDLRASSVMSGSSADVWAGLDSSGSPAEPVALRRKSTRVTRYVPACGGNVVAARITGDALCAGATALCDEGATLYWIMTAPTGTAATDPDWTFSGQVCRGADEAADQPLPVFTLADFRRLPIAPGKPHVQPGGEALINVDTNVYVEAEEQVLPTQLLGFPIRVRAKPQAYTWAFGDGGTLTTADPGAAYPDLRTTHVYGRPGRTRITLTTSFSGEYSVAGGAWQPIVGTAEVASAPVALTLLQARAQLVAP